MNKLIERILSIDPIHAGKRLDQVIATLLPEYSRSKITQWMKSGELLVNGKIVKPKEKAQGQETITLKAHRVADVDWQAEAMPLDIVFEDDDLLVINKSAHCVVHPAAGNRSGTLANALLAHCPMLNQLPRSGLIHRLDKDTTGLLVVAKSLEAHTNLVEQLQAREISRQYLAIIEGTITGGGTVDEPMSRHARNRQKMAVNPQGKEAITHYRLLENFQHYAYIKVMLETGRTHQIRVHMAHIHHPIVGDPLYNRLHLPKGCNEVLAGVLRGFKRQALHAERLAFIHPVSEEELSFTTPPPADFAALLAAIRANG